MYSEEEIHSQRIKVLQQMKPEIVAEKNLESLLSSIENGDILIQDVLDFTTISRGELEDLLIKRRNND